MSAEQTPDIERVLARCRCQDVHGDMYTPPYCESCRSWAAHVAQALAPVLAAAVREAEQRALLEAADHIEAAWNIGGDWSDWKPGESDGARIYRGITRSLRDRAGRVAEPQHEAATSGKEAVSEPTGAVDWRGLPHVHAGTDCAGGPDCPARSNGEGA